MEDRMSQDWDVSRVKDRDSGTDMEDMEDMDVSRVRLSAGSYLEVRLGQMQQENGLGHGRVSGLEDGRQEGGRLGLGDTRETGPD